MSDYLYNGVRLPKAPTEYADICPCAFITDDGGGNYSLYITARQIVLPDLSGGLVNIQAGKWGWYWLDNGEWGLERTPDVSTAFGCSYEDIIWTNTDILNPDGSVHLAASDPVPVYDPTALLQGYLVGCRIRAMRGKKKIVGYSYNGTVLPGLPEWDREKYPYAYISRAYGGIMSYAYFLRCFASEMVISANGQSMTTPSSENVLVTTWSRLEENATEWEAMGTDEWEGGNTFFLPKWTNTDILYADGTVYLAASDPIPAYE